MVIIELKLKPTGSQEKKHITPSISNVYNHQTINRKAGLESTESNSVQQKYPQASPWITEHTGANHLAS